MPRLSVVVCTYNRESTLRDVLSDLVAQDYPASEILVIDQSLRHEPETIAFFERLAGRISRIQRLEANLPAARNEGLRCANGDVVVFVDDDLRLPPHTLQAIATSFMSPDVDGIAPAVISSSEAEVNRVFEPVDWKSFGKSRRAVPAVIGACMAFRRRYAIEAGGFDEFLGRLSASASGEDIEFCKRFVQSGFGLWFEPGCTVLHHAFTPGGCEVRVGKYAGTSSHHELALTYIVLKEEGALRRLNARAVIRLLRSLVLRRDRLTGMRLLSAPRIVSEYVTDVRQRVAADSTKPGTSAAS